jgi:DNA-binding XRE family transcriptional regulator
MERTAWSDDAWRRLADEIRSARDARGLTQAQLAAEAGVGTRTLQDLEAGIPRGRMPRLLPRIERSLGWRPGSVRTVLAGGDPIPATAPMRPVVMSGAEKDVVRRYVEMSVMSAAAKRRILREIAEIPEVSNGLTN